MTICTECGKDDDCRPYGKNRSMICHKCGMLPENVEETKRNFLSMLSEAAEQGDGRVAFGTEAGPVPLKPKTIH